MKYSLWYLGKMGEHQHNDRVEGSHMVFQESNLPLTECRCIDVNMTFEIQPNNIIAACMKDQGSINPLRVTSFSMHEALQVTSIKDDCRDRDLQTLNIAILSSRTRNLLLVGSSN